ncbi:hypothetical protein AAFF_G00218660 [Aldrovandia affinis]|uniref:Uncharacterized protein n=1 Tax=Aldrovandia affinis TaxID=143900 RepID=A0AAD7SX86_9TELE|nr:hypothetical protein AAFF_G00218660 [Aldrovandia affinis]
MSNYVYCQTQVTTIMEILTKSVIGEIRKLFDDSSALLCLKIYRSLNENEALKTMMERELRTARGREEGREGARRSSVNTRSVGIQVFVEEQCRESVFEQEWSFRLKRDGEPTEESANMEEVRPESLLIKQEGLEEDSPPTPVVEEQVTQPTPAGGPEEQVAQCTPVEEGKKQETVPTPAGDPEELSEQHRCGHSDEELSGLEFAVKAEQEEEHVAQRPNQTGCEHSAGRLNNLGSEYAMYEKDSQLWTSFTQGDSDIGTDDPVCLNTTEQYSHSLSVPTELQHAPATVEGSGSTLSSFGASYDEVFDKMSGKQPVYGEELRSEAIHTQQGQYRERPVDTVEREDQTLLPQKQQHGPTVKQMRGGESRAQSHLGSQYEASSTLSAGTFNTGKKSQREIEVLKQKLQMLERELMKARGRKAERVFGQEWSFRLKRDREPTAVEERTTSLQSSLMRKQSGDMEEVRPESLLIKQERLEEDSPPTPVGEEQVTQPTPAGGPEEQVAQCTPVEEGKKLETAPTPAGDPEELSEQHRCGHSDEELSGLEFVVKAEQEEEHVAQRPNQTACEHSAGRLNNLGSDYVMYERDSQLWTSFTQGDSDIETDDIVCSNATEQHSQSPSVHTELQHAPATVEGSGSTLSSFGASYDEVFDKMSGKQPVYGEELRSEAIHTQQGQFRERLVHTVERENQTLLPQKQQHGPTVRQMRGEMCRCKDENEQLKQKVQLMESELRTARGSAGNADRAHELCSEEERPPPAERVFGQEWSFRLRRDGETTEEVNTPLQSSLTRNQVSSPVLFMKNQSVDMEEVRPESFLIKQEGLEDDLCYSDPRPTAVREEQVTQPTPAGCPEEQVAQCTPVEEGKKQETAPTPAGDPEELSEQHRCGHSDEELSGLEFVVKAEQEEEHVAQRPNQTGCEHSTGRLNNLGSEYVMYERDSQLWTSFTQGDSDIETDDPGCSNATEQYSQSLSVHTELQHAPATVEGSGNTLSSFGASYDEVFDKMSGKQPVYGEELRSEAIHTQQGQFRERLVHTVERENQTLLPQKQQHGLTVRQMRGGHTRVQRIMWVVGFGVLYIFWPRWGFG